MHELASVLEVLQERHCTSGSYVSPANRLLLMGLAMSMQAKDILETGTSTGGTALAFAMTGAHVVTIDHYAQEPEVASIAEERLRPYANVERLNGDALFYMATQSANIFDLIFLDDGHWPGYLYREISYAQRLLRPGGVLVCHDTLSCHMWDVIEGTMPTTWQRINLPSLQDGVDYTGIPQVHGQDFGLGIVRKPFAIHDAMQAYEQLPSLPGNLQKIPYDIAVARFDDQGNWYEHVGADGIESLVDYYMTLLETWHIRPDLLDASKACDAQKVLNSYGRYCAQRADEAMRRKFERL